MPEKHLFVNSYHYQDRPDPNMRYKIASHAARYGPNGSLATRTPSQGTDELAKGSSPISRNRGTPASPQSIASTPRVRPAPPVPITSPNDLLLRQDYDFMSARLSNMCICSNKPPEGISEDSRSGITHAEDCSILDDYLTVLREHELPFRAASCYRQSAASSLCTSGAEDLVLQCLLVVGQAAVDGLNPSFKSKPSNQTLQLQQKALNAMRRTINQRYNVIDDSIVVASSIMLSIAAFYADQDAYRAHHSSLQKFIELRGGFNQTQAFGVVKALMASSEISLAQHRYMANGIPMAAAKKTSSPRQESAQTPLKIKYATLPFTPELADIIDKMSSGFRPLAEASKISLQAIQMLYTACKWSAYIDQAPQSDTEAGQLLANTTDPNACARKLYEESIQTKRMAALLLISLPTDVIRTRLERYLCLGFLNLMHSVTLRPHPMPLRDKLVTDFAELILSPSTIDKNEEDCMIWLTLGVASEWRYSAAKLKASPLPASHGYDAGLLCQIWLQRSKQVMDRLLTKYGRTQSWEELASICSGFLWLQRLGSEWKQTWKEAMERRLRNMPRQRSQS